MDTTTSTLLHNAKRVLHSHFTRNHGLEVESYVTLPRCIQPRI